MLKINIKTRILHILSIRLKISQRERMDKRINIFMSIVNKSTSRIYITLLKLGKTEEDYINAVC